MGLPWCFGILEKHKWKGLLLDDTELKFQNPPWQISASLDEHLGSSAFQEITQFFWDYPDIIYFYFAMKDYDANYPVILRLYFFLPWKQEFCWSTMISWNVTGGFCFDCSGEYPILPATRPPQASASGTKPSSQVWCMFVGNVKFMFVDAHGCKIS